jgi:hypothetical protein
MFRTSGSELFETSGAGFTPHPSQHSLLTSTPLNTSGNMSKGSSRAMSIPPKELMNCGTDLWLNGTALGLRFVKKLIESMPRRLAAVIRANGGHTKY